MKKNRRIILAAVPIAIVGAFALIALTGQRAPPEPVYAGKTLSQWLEIFDPTNYYRPTVAISERAIREIGTNATPTLLRMLESHDSNFKIWFANLARKQHIVNIHYNYVPASNLHERAAAAFEVLQWHANPSVPDLIRIYDKELSPTSQKTVALLLEVVGPPAKAAVPSLVRGVSNTNKMVRWTAIEAIGKIHAEPEIAVPALVRIFPDPDNNVNFAIALSFGEFGPDAKAAVPALIKFLEAHPQQPSMSPTIPGVVLESLSQIDQAAAQRFITNHPVRWR